MARQETGARIVNITSIEAEQPGTRPQPLQRGQGGLSSS
jgi:hypothetical protein